MLNEFVRSKLRPWQIEPAQHLLEVLGKHDSALDSSETGTGKSYVAMAVSVSFQFSTLVVCPKISISMWHRVAQHFGDSVSVINYESLRTGRSLYGRWNNQEQVDAGPEGRIFDHVCGFCQMRIDFSKPHVSCYTNQTGIHCVVSKPRPIVRGVFNFDKAVKFLIFDEVHRCGGSDSLNADMLIAAKRQRIKHLMLSATPAQNILQMRAIGYSLDLFTL